MFRYTTFNAAKQQKKSIKNIYKKESKKIQKKYHKFIFYENLNKRRKKLSQSLEAPDTRSN